MTDRPNTAPEASISCIARGPSAWRAIESATMTAPIALADISTPT